MFFHVTNSFVRSLLLKHCDILRRAAEMGGLLVDAMVNPGDGSKKDSTSAPLMVVENGCGSPCIDLRQVSSELAAAAKDADLVSTKPSLILPDINSKHTKIEKLCSLFDV